MNIFYLDESPKVAAEYHCDKHVVKMILESAQMLCTAHRILDGVQTTVLTESGRKKKVWTLDGDHRNELMYGATHVNHPSAAWVRESPLHYMWLYNLMLELNREFILRYDKNDDHLTIRKLKKYLSIPPKALIQMVDATFIAPPQCMPDECKVENDTVAAYKNYYIAKKVDIAVWKNGNMPHWFIIK